MRLFIAIKLDDEMIDALGALQSDLQFCGMQGRYTREENMHLTLAFIGEYPDPQSVLDALENVRVRPFEICLDGAGHFDDLWWAGIRSSEDLNTLVKQVRHALAEAGIPFDRKRFKPHITLVRSARWHGDQLESLNVEPVRMTVDRISLMRSDRGKHGMIYTKIQR